VIFRNAVVPALPASAATRLTPEDLWDALDRDCRTRRRRCEALVIPQQL
jgi:hypothetical protein